ncbi:hypothetical protein AYI68_g2061 [Smittium mucronatum]|uniref:THO complex subunit 1 n=1 Tax=Smittium mucronatum TaxID=133383 RepID=A0A1R0H3S4_9FUNG|nr:hypothetical protein AYI68_g2061 [Smittium mucronatum]
MSNIPTTSGKGQIMLRMLNNLIDRIPRTSDYCQFRGSVMQFSASLFNLNERSGINFKGEFASEFPLEYEVDLLHHLHTQTAQENGEIVQNTDNNPDLKIEDSFDNKNVVETDLTITPTVATETIIEPDINTVPKITPSSNTVLGKRGRPSSLSEDSIKFYLSFWELQKYFSSPWLAFEGSTFDTVSIKLKMALMKLAEGDKLPQSLYYAPISIGSISISKNEPPIPSTYFTNPILLNNQLSDPRFRCQILIQIMIFCNYVLLATKENVDLQLAAPTVNKNTILNFSVSPEQITWKNENCKTFEKPEMPEFKKEIESLNSMISQRASKFPKIPKLKNSKIINQLENVSFDIDSLPNIAKIFPDPKACLNEVDLIIQNPSLVSSSELQAKFELERWKALRSFVFENPNKITSEPSRDLKELKTL